MYTRGWPNGYYTLAAENENGQSVPVFCLNGVATVFWPTAFTLIGQPLFYYPFNGYAQACSQMHALCLMQDTRNGLDAYGNLDLSLLQGTATFIPTGYESSCAWFDGSSFYGIAAYVWLSACAMSRSLWLQTAILVPAGSLHNGKCSFMLVLKSHCVFAVTVGVGVLQPGRQSYRQCLSLVRCHCAALTAFRPSWGTGRQQLIWACTWASAHLKHTLLFTEMTTPLLQYSRPTCGTI